MRRPKAHILLLVGPMLLATSCDKHDQSASPLEFRGEQPFIPGLEVDTGWVPEASPPSVRALVSAGGGVTVVAHATTDDGSMSPTAGSGELSVSS